MANDLNEEEAVVIDATTALLGAMVALLINHINRDTDNETRVPQIPRQPYVNGDVDRNVRMIRMSPDVYSTYVEANPTRDKYLNKKIDMHDEMAIVVGKDVARGSGAKSFDDVEIQSHENTNLEEKGESDDEFVKENDNQSTSSAPLESRKSQKRTRDNDLEIQNISTQMAEVAIALQKISKSKLDVGLFYQEVMTTEGFEECFLGSAFDHLVERENFAKGFLAKSHKLRRIWLEKFKENN